MSAIDEVFARPIAHRGLHGQGQDAVENSATAFALAIAGGFGIECDLQLTGDQVPLVFHDETIDRLTGQSGAVADISAEQAIRIPFSGSREGPITLPQMLNLVGGRVPLVIELKTQQTRNLALAKATMDALTGYQGVVAIKSFEPRLLTAMRSAGFTGPLGILIGPVSLGGEPGDSTATLQVAGRMALRQLIHEPPAQFDFISTAYSIIDLPAFNLLRRVGKKMMAWTIRSHEEAKNALDHADQIVFEGFMPKR